MREDEDDTEEVDQRPSKREILNGQKPSSSILKETARKLWLAVESGDKMSTMKLLKSLSQSQA